VKKIHNGVLYSEEEVVKMIRIYFRSKTARAIFTSLTYKKQREWVTNLVNDLESLQDKKGKTVKEVTMTELAS
jgi:hypothetical protein